ncbi:hypothetical protein LTR78_004952 [Recurvomyces mirabilis]|uniref:Sde2 N-terminal ubiquitin domain-containing protein n=1 Tax=Recurvomyces mirabilis TaxID=574656 RepID=A0AAE0WNH7_9PEZI|nr:hypothetical protein LTR78_004952 [Recurvomyces mirabilis]KAK5158431.1 hypothetical protein LTS14_003450 [Recurvomyces mirabilis]
MATTITTRSVEPSTTPAPSSASLPSPTINILLTSFAGLGLPRTLSLPVSGSTPTGDIVKTILARLPRIDHPLIITTTDNKQLLSTEDAPIASLLADSSETFLPLRLSARLCGGKGGFGSQLRAAGGRMSSRKNRNQNVDPNGSNRNLDGRRLRTVDEAKKLADYLAIKPEMEKKEKEERKKRWEAVVEAAERREEEIKSGKLGAGQGRLDAEYVESKEAAEEKTREAVLKAMREEMEGLERTGSESSVEEAGEESGEDENGGSASSQEGKAPGNAFFGWDEDEDDEDDDDDQDDEMVEEHNEATKTEATAYQGQGKSKARAR